MPKFAFRALFIITLLLTSFTLAHAASKLSFDYDDSKIYLGVQAQAQFGSQIEVGDVNGDAHLDLLVSSPYYTSANLEERGKVELFLGPLEITDSKADLTILGASSGDQLGTALEIDDVNSDGINDMIIGASKAKISENNRPGAVYVFLGNTHISGLTYDLTSYQPDLTIYGPHNKSFFGSSILAMDIDANNSVDILVGAPLSQNAAGHQTGNVYAVYWRNVFSSEPFFNLSARKADVTISGYEKFELFGSKLATGNFNNNPQADLLVSAYAASVDAKEQAGKVYMYKDFTSFNHDRKKPDTVFLGTKANDWLGFNLSVGDINGDDMDDIFLSTFTFNKTLQLAETYVIPGFKGMGIIDEFPLDKTRAEYFSKIEEGVNKNILGSSVVALDMDRDDKNEIVISSPNVSSTSRNPSVVSIYEATWILKNAVFSLSQNSPTNKIESDSKQDWFGHRVISADMNRDGLKDLIISAPYRENLFMPQTGAVHVFFAEIKDPANDVEIQSENDDKTTIEALTLTRGEMIAQVLEKFNLQNTYSSFLNTCYSNPKFCMFFFTSQSQFLNILLDGDIVLYPDVPKTHPYYKEITVATMLGLVNGNLSVKDSPFNPDAPVSKIQALKVILEAAELERSNFFNNITKDMGGEAILSKFLPIYDDVKKEHEHMWWYPRYVNFAYKIGVLPRQSELQPDKAISQKEFEELLNGIYSFGR